MENGKDKSKEEKIKEIAKQSLEVLKLKFPDEAKDITEKMIEDVLKETL